MTDAVGNVTSYTDPLGNVTNSMYNDTGGNYLEELCWTLPTEVSSPMPRAITHRPVRPTTPTIPTATSCTDESFGLHDVEWLLLKRSSVLHR